MPRPASRFVEKLTKSQLGKLKDLMAHGDTPRLRHRAHAVLLSHQGVCVVDLAEVFQTNRTTVTVHANAELASVDSQHDSAGVARES